VVEIGDPMCEFDRMMIGKEMPQWTEADSLCSRECLSNQEVRCRTWLPVRSEMFANPSLLEAKRIEALQFLEVAELTVPY
jgi:hypothetical protein